MPPRSLYPRPRTSLAVAHGTCRPAACTLGPVRAPRLGDWDQDAGVKAELLGLGEHDRRVLRVHRLAGEQPQAWAQQRAARHGVRDGQQRAALLACRVGRLLVALASHGGGGGGALLIQA